MAKNKPYDFDRAKALWGLGKTIREIEAQTKIPRSTIERQAKKEGWGKGSLGQLVTDTVRLAEDFGSKSGTERDIVQDEAERILRAKGAIEKVSLLAIKRISQLIPEEDNLGMLNQGMNALKTAMITTGAVDYYPKAKEQQKQAENDAPKKVVFEVVNGVLSE